MKFAADVELSSARVFDAGTHEIPPCRLVGDYSELGVYFDSREYVDPNVRIVLTSYISEDDGKTWRVNGWSPHSGVPLAERHPPPGGDPHLFGHSSRRHVADAKGQPMLYTNKSPLVKATVTITGGAVFTTLSVKALQ